MSGGVAADGATGLDRAARGHPDIIVLDLGLPDIDGLEVLAALRAWTKVPIVVLSARDSDVSKVDALDNGADDYVTKPFSMDELLARVRAALRRRAVAAEVPIIETPHFKIDLGAKQVTLADGESVRLTPTEWGILDVLVRNPGKLVGQRKLLQEGVGTAVRGGDELLARVPRCPPSQARTGTVPAALPDHRTRHGLSLRAVIRAQPRPPSFF